MGYVMQLFFWGLGLGVLFILFNVTITTLIVRREIERSKQPKLKPLDLAWIEEQVKKL
jgi:hypothetical protein